MIIITFSFLGKDVVVGVEGDHCMNKEYNENEELKKIRSRNKQILDKEGLTFKEAYKWCEVHTAKKWKKGRHTNFVF